MLSASSGGMFREDNATEIAIKNITEIRRDVEKINDHQTIHNEDIFGPVQNDTIIIAIQVSASAPDNFAAHARLQVSASAPNNFAAHIQGSHSGLHLLVPSSSYLLHVLGRGEPRRPGSVLHPYKLSVV
ncbi:UDP-N-acetylglucosamine:alpha-6-D-mannoside beta-1,2-N-acetylglucosaminyltransferase II [Operophtera brumata]|uniref:UDP-N-acetylglucosamine:alpha-6-D-mannoside beta-1,2-N-acetylglucosaminyltransferase II n=1 Tax=Operophtera brumata TaxID=104452 RepID=A0A0L7LKF9_OPEBR|nr:UDP-N-acetylglucosamine:alpha-6-D-mannoside beta-1,2-N-acetylglucosaminyltransferase II [Operophtera brumata]